MSEQTAGRFIDALGKLETSRDVEAMVALFAENCDVGNVIAPEKFSGRDGARQFWTKYRETFGEVRSTFRNRIVESTRAALEWTTEATSVGGASVNYDGVSILEIEGEHITRFRAYFDAEDLGRQVAGETTARSAHGNA